MNEDYTISYFSIRKIIGFLGIIFPGIMIIGLYFLGGNIGNMPGSISAFYYTVMRNIFVCLLTATGISFFFYRSRQKYFNGLLNLAAVCALGVALCPTTDGNESNISATGQIVGQVHLGFAATLFLIQGIFCLFFFPKSEDKQNATKQQQIRITIYKICGALIFISLAMMAIYLFMIESKLPELKAFHPIFMLETCGLYAAGMAWMVKGEVLFKDI